MSRIGRVPGLGLDGQEAQLGSSNGDPLPCPCSENEDSNLLQDNSAATRIPVLYPVNILIEE